MSELLKKKKETLERLLQGEHVLVHLDSSDDGVIVPAHLKGNIALTLKLSHFFQGAIVIDDTAVKANLVFSGNYFECLIPWHAIWGMTSENQECFLWMDGFPTTLGSAHFMKEAKGRLSNAGALIDRQNFGGQDDVQEDSEVSSLDNGTNASVNREAVRKAVLRRVK